MIKYLTKASACFSIEFFHLLICNTTAIPTGTKGCFLHSTLLRVQITTSLPYGKTFFLLDLVGPFFFYLHCLRVSYGRLSFLLITRATKQTSVILKSLSQISVPKLYPSTLTCLHLNYQHTSYSYLMPCF
jgi:hypothetical protein